MAKATRHMNPCPTCGTPRKIPGPWIICKKDLEVEDQEKIIALEKLEEEGNKKTNWFFALRLYGIIAVGFIFLVIGLNEPGSAASSRYSLGGSALIILVVLRFCYQMYCYHCKPTRERRKIIEHYGVPSGEPYEIVEH